MFTLLFVLFLVISTPVSFFSIRNKIVNTVIQNEDASFLRAIEKGLANLDVDLDLSSEKTLEA